jgi:IS30 family transposase
LANNPRLRQVVASKLILNWSPEQIAGWLKRSHPGDECYHVSQRTQSQRQAVSAMCQPAVQLPQVRLSNSQHVAKWLREPDRWRWIYFPGPSLAGLSIVDYRAVLHF